MVTEHPADLKILTGTVQLMVFSVADWLGAEQVNSP
jgi:hypothetical protein